MDLSGQLLVAMPGMGDPRFERSVIFICAHSSDGAMGLVINRPAEEVGFADLLDQLSIETEEPPQQLPAVHHGGPVEHGRGFVLHSDEYGGNDSTLKVSGGFSMTATLDILEDIAKGEGPDSSLLALGYSGWAEGQLEEELQGNAWLVAEAQSEIVFANEDTDKWAAALAVIGIDPKMLSGEAGRA